MSKRSTAILIVLACLLGGIGGFVTRAWLHGQTMTATVTHKGFDPSRQAPTTDEEVAIVWQEYDPGVGRALAGLYATYRARGKSIEDAYEQTLQAHLEAMTSPKPRQAPRLLP